MAHAGSVRLHAFNVATRGIAPIVQHVVGHLVEHGPHAEVAEAGTAKIDRGVYIGERELFVRTVVKFGLFCEADDIVGIDAVDVGVLEELVDVLEGDAGLAFLGG